MRDERTSERPHVAALDGIRGLAALVVLVHHMTPDTSEAWVAHVPGLQWLHAGWIGVDLFFVLSGFLITGILLDERGGPHYFRNFYARRALRIFPLYYGVLIGLFVLLPAALSLQISVQSSAALQHYREIQSNQVWLWTYLSNFAEAFRDVSWGFVGHFWSLAVEEQFYLVWPFVVWCAGRRGLLVICPLAVALALTLRLAAPALDWPSRVDYIFTPCRLDGLALGALMAVLARSRGGLAAWSRVIYSLGWMAGVLVIGGFLWQGSPAHGKFFQTIGFTLLAILFAAVLVAAYNARPGSLTSRVLGSNVLRFLGKYSYGIYVYNRLLVFPVRQLVDPEELARQTGSPLAATIVLQVAGIATTIGVAMLSWRLIESPCLRLKKYFGNARVPAALDKKPAGGFPMAFGRLAWLRKSIAFSRRLQPGYSAKSFKE